MTENASQFVGSIPENYDRGLGPNIFEDYGADIARRAGETGARFLLIAGRPLNEPVARGGPFVMNTREEITRAFEDYSNGVLA